MLRKGQLNRHTRYHAKGSVVSTHKEPTSPVKGKFVRSQLACTAFWNRTQTGGALKTETDTERLHERHR